MPEASLASIPSKKEFLLSEGLGIYYVINYYILAA